MARWRTVPGFPAYEVSDLGGIRTEKRYVRAELKPALCRERGYFYVNLNDDMFRSRTFRLHTLVLLAFVGTRPRGMVGRHIDGNKENNALANLCWGTRTENHLDRWRHGSHKKMTIAKVAELRDLRAKGWRYPAIAKRFGISISYACELAKHRAGPPPNVQAMA